MSVPHNYTIDNENLGFLLQNPFPPVSRKDKRYFNVKSHLKIHWLVKKTCHECEIADVQSAAMTENVNDLLKIFRFTDEE